LAGLDGSAARTPKGNPNLPAWQGGPRNRWAIFEEYIVVLAAPPSSGGIGYRGGEGVVREWRDDYWLDLCSKEWV